MSPTVRTIMVFLALVVAIVAASLIFRQTAGPAQATRGFDPTAVDESTLHPEAQAGLEALRERREDDALAHFRNVPGESPDYALALQRIAVILAKRGELIEAQASMIGLSQLRPHDPEPHALLGWLFYLAEDYERAELAALRTLELDANHLATRYNISLYRVGQNRSQRAVSSYLRAMREDPQGLEIQAHRERLREFHDAHADQPTAHFALAFVAGAMGDRRVEVEELEHYLGVAGPGPEMDAARVKLEEARVALGAS